MKKWFMIGFLFSALTVSCILLISAILLSDGGDMSRFRLKKTKKAEKTLKNSIDWEKLRKENPNVYAWIEVPGTNIDYPVLQAGKDQKEDFYLKHNLNDNVSFAGCIYSQKENAKDFRDPVTVLYGHSMLNGSMFGSLRKFSDTEFFFKHDTVYIYLPDRILVYRILSFFITDNRHILDTYHPETESGLRKYEQAIMGKKQGNHIRDETPDVDSRILTLSTCSAWNGRKLLNSVLIKEQETK